MQTKTTIPTLSEYFKSSSAYWGEKQNWLVAETTSREASTLDRSNWKSFIQLLGGKGSEGSKGSCEISDNLAIEEASHWAVGWVQYLVINPDAKELVSIVEKTMKSLENYPVINDEDWSQLESEEADQVWKDCYCPKERLKYMREHRSQFEFRDFADLIGCARGKYFSGYASELLN